MYEVEDMFRGFDEDWSDGHNDWLLLVITGYYNLGRLPRERENKLMRKLNDTMKKKYSIMVKK